MKKAEEYLEDIKEKYNIGSAWQITYPYIVEAITQAQIDATEETCKACAEEATTKSFKLSKYSKTPRWKLVKEGEEVDLYSYDFITKVNKQSILSVADKLKKEL